MTINDSTLAKQYGDNLIAKITINISDDKEVLRDSIENYKFINVDSATLTLLFNYHHQIDDLSSMFNESEYYTPVGFFYNKDYDNYYLISKNENDVYERITLDIIDISISIKSKLEC